MMLAADPHSEEFSRLGLLVWSRKATNDEQLAAFRAIIVGDDPARWVLAQAAEFTHPVHAVREEARSASAQWAQRHGLPLHLWADRVAATQSRDDARFMRLQCQRLEWAFRRQHVWPHAALEQIIHHDEPIHSLVRALWWLDEHDRLCWLDERAVLRDLAGNDVQAKELRIAHPAHAAVKGISFLPQRIDTCNAPFQQWSREVFGADALQRDTFGWYRPRWEEPLPLYRIYQDLRRRGRWRYTHAEDNGTVAGFYLDDERANQTALWRMMDKSDEPRYGYMVYDGFHSPDMAVRVGLLILRGVWDRPRLDWSFAWPPNDRPYGIQPKDLCPIDEADPIFLSEVVRDVWIASTKRANNDPEGSRSADSTVANISSS